jgi:hypothetical protein
MGHLRVAEEVREGMARSLDDGAALDRVGHAFGREQGVAVTDIGLPSRRQAATRKGYQSSACWLLEAIKTLFEELERVRKFIGSGRGR